MKSGKKLFQKIQIKKNSQVKISPFHQKLQVQFNPENNHQKKTELIPVKQTKLNAKQGYSFQNENQQQSKITSLNNNFNNLSASIEDLKSSYQDLTKSEKSIKVKHKQKNPQNQKIKQSQNQKIKQFIAIKKKQKAQRQKNLQKSLQLRDLKIRQEEQKQQHQIKQQKMKNFQQIRKLTSVIKQNVQIKKQSQKQKQKHAQQIFKKYKDKVPLFSIKQKEDQEQKAKKQIELKQIIKKRKQIYKPHKIDQIIEHQKRHEQKLNKLAQQKQQTKIKELSKIIEDNNKMKDLYRGKGTENYIQQISALQQKKEIPFKVRTKIKEYQQYVKDHHLPKHSIKQKRGFSSSLDLKAKRNQESTQSFRQIRRYKYLHGVSYGSVLQAKPSPKSFGQQKKIGNSYMQFMKSLPKKKNLTNNQVIEIPIILKSSKENPLSHKRKKNTNINLNQQPTRQQINMVLLQLKNYDKKINQKQKIINQKTKVHRQSTIQIKQIDQDLLFNVEKKLNLLHKLETQ